MNPIADYPSRAKIRAHKLLSNLAMMRAVERFRMGGGACRRLAGAPLLLILVAWTVSCSHAPAQANISETSERVYVVELQPWAPDQKYFADSVAKVLGGRVRWIYKNFRGFSIALPSDSAAARLGRMREVKSMVVATIEHTI